MSKEPKKTKQEKPAPGFDDLVKTLLNTPPAPKTEKKDNKGNGKSNRRVG